MRSAKTALTSIAASILLLCAAYGETGSAFAPLAEWKAAVTQGDQAAVARFYSSDPPAQIQSGQGGKEKVDVDQEVRFWSGLRYGGVTDFNPKLLSVTHAQGQTILRLRVSAFITDVTHKGPGQAVVASMVQIWVEQPDGWRIVASRHTDFSPDAVRQLPQPAVPNPDLYAPPQEAEAELKAASEEAAKQHKRVLVVFGANWCYDCHVLDTTFRSKEFARLVDANYVVVHINIGDEGKDNHEMAARLGVVLDKGIPSLAVLEPNGSVVLAQKGGEFESTVKIGPSDVRSFLERWKPRT